MRKSNVLIDLIVLVMVLTAAGAILSLIAHSEVCCPAPTEATVPTEATEEVTEPTKEETTATEATEVTEVVTEPSVTLYDVPLSSSLQEHIIEQADLHGIDPAIVVAMAWKESSYNHDAIGDGGDSVGLLQIQEKWHRSRMERLDCTNLLDPYQNVTVGVDYLAENLNRYGSIEAALTAYNCGSYSGTVTQYARSVMAMAKQLNAD